MACGRPDTSGRRCFEGKTVNMVPSVYNGFRFSTSEIGRDFDISSDQISCQTTEYSSSSVLRTGLVKLFLLERYVCCVPSTPSGLCSLLAWMRGYSVFQIADHFFKFSQLNPVTCLLFRSGAIDMSPKNVIFLVFQMFFSLGHDRRSLSFSRAAPSHDPRTDSPSFRVKTSNLETVSIRRIGDSFDLAPWYVHTGLSWHVTYIDGYLVRQIN